jgi:hypothetical protein
MHPKRGKSSSILISQFTSRGQIEPIMEGRKKGRKEGKKERRNIYYKNYFIANRMLIVLAI